ncbi:MAG: DNA polymerase III subunit delta', partial [Omnitrophica WOR_2 bacterium RBG_13_44_8b]
MSFKNIRGQDKAINILKNYIAQSRLLGSYILTGPEGVGKQLVALNLAKTLNCQDNGAEPCDACASCQKIDKNQHPDVHVIACADSQIQIEYIRQLQSRSSLKPYEGRVKVFIINDAHRLTAEASNALLKILEEPPKNTLIILITDKLNLLFKTIISRCKILRFSPLIRTELQEIISRDYGVDKASAHFLAYFSEGRLGCALRLKDTDILREKNRVIDAFGQSLTKTYENLNIQGKPEIRQNLNILA